MAEDILDRLLSDLSPIDDPEAEQLFKRLNPKPILSERDIVSAPPHLDLRQPLLFEHGDDESAIGVLVALLGREGFTVYRRQPLNDISFFVAQRPRDDADPDTLAVNFRHFSQGDVVDVEQLHSFIEAPFATLIRRLIFATNARFAHAAREFIRQGLPLNVELVDPDYLKGWISRIDAFRNVDRNEVLLILTNTSRALATLIAREPSYLDDVEWRDLERIIAAVFDELGFAVTLTPGSKDGGKDIVLQCTVSGASSKYLVEIKHWRSRKRVGSGATHDFLNVVMREHGQGGLFLATYGYCDNAFEMLTDVHRCYIRFGDKKKIVALCEAYTKAESALWMPAALPTILFEHTV